MCGFAGYLRLEDGSDARAQNTLADMAQSIFHRGPDGVGSLIDPNFAFTHRRLSILDVSDAGKQPMTSQCGTYTIIFNGEIYNHLNLRSELERERAVKWRSSSDTETLLETISHWGLAPVLSKASGMFALALWNHKTGTLQLARDRIGEKPLYYGWSGEDFVFASELKPIKCHPRFAAKISKLALSQYFKFSYVPAPLSIWENIFKLEAGMILTVMRETLKSSSAKGGLSALKTVCDIKPYWSLEHTIETAQDNPITSEPEAMAALEACLQKSVTEQMISDVPLGAFLSGGIDSSLLVAMMQKESPQKVKTFTIGFEDKKYDESGAAREIAKHLKTDHTELIVTSDDALNVVPNLPNIYDEPFADSSQIPTHLVSKLARQSVTVALSGDGGDELFGGYNKYFWMERYWKYFNIFPFPARKALGRLVQSGGFKALADQAPTKISPVLDKVSRMGERLSYVQSLDHLYVSLTTQYRTTGPLLLNHDMSLDVLPEGLSGSAAADLGLSDIETMMFLDTKTYLAGDILCKVDRAAMATSLETRAPYLHPDLLKLAWRIPLSMKVKGDVGKWILREVLFKYVPREMYDRPKAGFGIPVGDWIKGPLREWAEALISPDRLLKEGYLNPLYVEDLWREHLEGKRDWTTKLWAILMFQAWLEDQ